MKLVIFDFEGTLVDFQWKLKDSLKTIMQILNGYRINYNIPCDDEKYQKMNYSLLYNYFSKTIDDPYLKRKIMNDFDRVYDYYDDDASLRWSLYPHVREVLEGLKKKGCKIAIDSNVGRRALDKMLKKFMLCEYFDITISRNDVNLLKPNPEGIFKILEYFKDCDFREKYFIGDSVTDIKTARKSKKGFKIISVAIEGEDKIDKLLAHKPDHLIHSISEVLDLV